jgi:glycosyltransferase involved in cell wall biosynthesis
MKPTVVVIIPAYNEEATLEMVLVEFRSELPEAMLVVVDNNSSDGTADVARRVLGEIGGPSLLLSEPRQGKGMAVRTALRRVDADYYVLTDADGTYTGWDAKALLRLLQESGADMAVGDRHAGGAYDDVNARPFHSVGNTLVTGLVNRMYGSRLKDVMSGLRVFTRSVAATVPLLHDGFEIETEISVYCLDRRLRVVEAPIGYRSRPAGSESKLRTFRDGSRVLRLIFMLFKDYRPLAFFGGLGALALLLGLLAGAAPIVDYVQYRYVYRVPLAVLAVGLVLSGVVAITTGLVLDTVVKIERQSFERRLRARPGGADGEE